MLNKLWLPPNTLYNAQVFSAAKVRGFFEIRHRLGIWLILGCLIVGSLILGCLIFYIEQINVESQLFLLQNKGFCQQSKE